jgi:hypothetical protein
MVRKEEGRRKKEEGRRKKEEGISPMAQFRIVPFDGVNWEQNVHLLRDENDL